MKELEREELATRASKREHLPSLELAGQWGYASETIADDMKDQWAIQLGVSMPVFEGFRIQSQTRAQESIVRQKEIQLEELRDQIESDYRLALQNLRSSVQQVEVSSRTLSLSEREFELARIRFEEGVADNSDVVVAQASLANAEDTLVEAEFYYVLALVNLARVEGNVRDFRY
jgi:outer membrane protein TolC